MAAQRLLGLITEKELPQHDERNLADISTVKGLFKRVVRQDQWDWFTVARQLGYPSCRISEVIARQLTEFRVAIKNQSEESYSKARVRLLRLPFRRCLSVFLELAEIVDEPDAGWIYILSTRELPDLLKIGMTSRTVEQRVNEINRATGVAIPFGVRRCWRVTDPGKVEKLVHSSLVAFRMRDDREFFQLEFRLAEKIVDHAIISSRLEIRTLDALAALKS
jgi:hypothetical protein